MIDKMIKGWQVATNQMHQEKMHGVFQVDDWMAFVEIERKGAWYVGQFLKPDEKQHLDSELGKMLAEYLNR